MQIKLNREDMRLLADILYSRVNSNKKQNLYQCMHESIITDLLIKIEKQLVEPKKNYRIKLKKYEALAFIIFCSEQKIHCLYSKNMIMMITNNLHQQIV